MRRPIMNPERVSIVVTTRNESRNIGNCLDSIKAQSYAPELIEIIVVDNASTDDTKEIAALYTDKVFDKGPERSSQRNFGFAQATGGVFMFLDADMILSSTVVEKSVAMLRGGGFGALYIPEIVLGRGFFPSVRRFERSFYDATVIDCVRVFTREAFEATGGFDERLTGPEDWDFDRLMRDRCRVGLLSTYDFDDVDAYVSRLPDERFVPWLTGYEQRTGDATPLLFHNEAAFDLWRYLTKKTYYGNSFETYAAKWPAGDPDVRRQLGMPYRFFGVFFEQGRWCRLLTHPRLGLGMYFLRFMVGFMFLVGKFNK